MKKYKNEMPPSTKAILAALMLLIFSSPPTTNIYISCGSDTEHTETASISSEEQRELEEQIYSICTEYFRKSNTEISPDIEKIINIAVKNAIETLK